jgi:hypothetical protein
MSSNLGPTIDCIVIGFIIDFANCYTIGDAIGYAIIYAIDYAIVYSKCKAIAIGYAIMVCYLGYGNTQFGIFEI